MNLFWLAQTTSEATCTVNGSPVDCAEAGATLGGVMIVLSIFGLVSFVFTLWMFIHVLTHDSKNKVLWALIIFFTGLLGALVYFFTERKKVNNPSANEVASTPAGQSPIAQAQPHVPPSQPQQPIQPQPTNPEPTPQPPVQSGPEVVQPQAPADNNQNQQPPQS